MFIFKPFARGGIGLARRLQVAGGVLVSLERCARAIVQLAGIRAVVESEIA